MLPLVTAFRLTVSFAVNTPLLVIFPVVVVREISLPASADCTLILPAPVVTLTLPEVAVTFSPVVTPPAVLDNVTSVLAFTTALDVTPFCAVTSTSPFTDSTAPFKVTMPATASTSTFWSAVAAPPRTIFPWVAPTVIVPPFPSGLVAVNVPDALVSILPFAVWISISLPLT